MLSFFVQRRMYKLWYIIMRNYFCKTWSKCWRQFHRPLQISDRVLHRQSECTCQVVRKERLRINIKKTQIWADAVSRQDSRVNTKYKCLKRKQFLLYFPYIQHTFFSLNKMYSLELSISHKDQSRYNHVCMVRLTQQNRTPICCLEIYTKGGHSRRLLDPPKSGTLPFKP